MDTKRRPWPLLLCAALLPTAAALASNAFPEAASFVERTPWAAAPVAAAAFLLPLPLFMLGFRDVGVTAPVWLRRSVIGIGLPLLGLAASCAVIFLLEFGRGGLRLAAFALWSAVCAGFPTLLRWAWSCSPEPLPAPARLSLALAAALMAHGSSLAVAARAGTYAGELSQRAAQCRAADAAERERIERDRPRTPDLEAELEACSSLGYRLALRDGGRRPAWSAARPRRLGGWKVS